MKLTNRQKEIILAVAQCDMSLNRVAEMLYFHRNTVVYHCDAIHRNTGLNPRRFYDLEKLLKIVRCEDG